MKRQKIAELQGGYRFLSNFHPCTVIDDQGIEYPSVEHAYQAAKTLNKEERVAISLLETPGKAKRQGRKVTLRQNWEFIKYDAMFDLVLQKFTKHPGLREKLLETSGMEIEEGNTWGDETWGINLKTGKGKNWLGKILMSVRRLLEKEEREKEEERIKERINWKEVNIDSCANCDHRGYYKSERELHCNEHVITTRENGKCDHWKEEEPIELMEITSDEMREEIRERIVEHVKNFPFSWTGEIADRFRLAMEDAIDILSELKKEGIMKKGELDERVTRKLAKIRLDPAMFLDLVSNWRKRIEGDKIDLEKFNVEYYVDPECGDSNIEVSFALKMKDFKDILNYQRQFFTKHFHESIENVLDDWKVTGERKSVVLGKIVHVHFKPG